MQPYFFPYIGYFQLLAAVDKFVIYDDVEWSRGGWINRNRIQRNGNIHYVGVPVQKGRSSANINEQLISGSVCKNRTDFLRKIEAAYSRAPQYGAVYEMLSSGYSDESDRLVDLLESTLRSCCAYLEIDTPLVRSSELQMPVMPPQERVLCFCSELNATTYINASGGRQLYDVDVFEKHGVELKFLHSQPREYSQQTDVFNSMLSIIDVMMFNSISEIKTHLSSFWLD